MIPGISILILIMTRNLFLIGMLGPGPRDIVSGDIFGIFKKTVYIHLNFLLGYDNFQYVDSYLKGFYFALFGFLLLSITAMGLFNIISKYRIKSENRIIERNHHILYLLFYIFIYLIGIIYLIKGRGLAAEARYFLPVIPAMLLFLAYIINNFVSYIVHIYKIKIRYKLVINSVSSVILARIGILQVISYYDTYKENIITIREGNDNIREYMVKNANIDDSVMIIGNGQILAYLLNRKAVIVPKQKYSKYGWNRDRILERIGFYNVKWVVLLNDVERTDYDDYVFVLKNKRAIDNMVCVYDDRGGRIYYVNI